MQSSESSDDEFTQRLGEALNNPYIKKLTQVDKEKPHFLRNKKTKKGKENLKPTDEPSSNKLLFKCVHQRVHELRHLNLQKSLVSNKIPLVFNYIQRQENGLRKPVQDVWAFRPESSLKMLKGITEHDLGLEKRNSQCSFDDSFVNTRKRKVQQKTDVDGCKSKYEILSNDEEADSKRNKTFLEDMELTPPVDDSILIENPPPEPVFQRKKCSAGDKSVLKQLSKTKPKIMSNVDLTNVCSITFTELLLKQVRNERANFETNAVLDTNNNTIINFEQHSKAQEINNSNKLSTVTDSSTLKKTTISHRIEDSKSFMMDERNFEVNKETFNSLKNSSLAVASKETIHTKSGYSPRRMNFFVADLEGTQKDAVEVNENLEDNTNLYTEEVERFDPLKNKSPILLKGSKRNVTFRKRNKRKLNVRDQNLESGLMISPSKTSRIVISPKRQQI